MGHIPVMFKETLKNLSVKPDGIYLDMTLGGFGHGRAICEKLSEKGVYIGLDLDDDAIARANALKEGLKCRTVFEKTDYNDFTEVLEKYGIKEIDGCLFDLGVSSFQIDDPQRGFSFMKDGPLDMRMDAQAEFSAEDVINEYGEAELKQILYRYGEEKYAPQITRGIIKARTNKRITTTSELVEIIKSNVPAAYVYRGKNPAAKTFQAVRIEVNGELNRLADTINEVIDRTKAGGRIAVISFHSLEDRIVKEVFSERARGCICPKELPVCVCGHKPEVKIITKSPIVAGEKEIEQNARSRSAKLRCAQKL